MDTPDMSAGERSDGVRLQIEIKDSLHEQLRLVAGTRGISLSSLVREALEDAIDPDVATGKRLWKENDARLEEEDPFGLMTNTVAAKVLHEVSLVKDTPEGRAAGQGYVIPGVVKGSEFHPAPKPVGKKRT